MGRLTALETAEAIVGLTRGTRYSHPMDRRIAQHWVEGVERLPRPSKGRDYVHLTFGIPRGKILSASKNKVSLIAGGLGEVRDVVKPMACEGIADMLGAINVALLMDAELRAECGRLGCYPIAEAAKPWRAPRYGI